MSKEELSLKEIEEHKNELVLDFFEVVRLVGFHQDADDNYYKLLSAKNGRYHSSCVTGLIYLKKHLPVETYEALEQVFNMNIIETNIIEKPEKIEEKIEYTQISKKIIDKARYLYSLQTGKFEEFGPAINSIVLAIAEYVESKTKI